MKTIFCGPPHSGKSVLVNNITWLLPSDSYQVIRANGDGEGLWSNNENQTDVQAARKKGTNNPEDFARWRQQIDTAAQDIVIVDIGGRIDDYKKDLFEACDNFVVLSSDPDMALKWKEFGEGFECECLAVLDSCLDGNDEIFATTPLLRARITGLERGATIAHSHVLRALADRIVLASGYKPRTIIDMDEVCEQLGYCKQWQASNGMTVHHNRVPEEQAAVMYDKLLSLRQPTAQRYQVVNTPNNFVAAIIANTLWNLAQDDLLLYDEWTNRFVQPTTFRLQAELPEQELQFDIVEEADAILLHAYTESGLVSTKHFHEYVFPVLNTEKPLYLSGRFPIWMVASIVKSHPNREQYLYQPGKGYFCVTAPKKEILGTLSQRFVQK